MGALFFFIFFLILIAIIIVLSVVGSFVNILLSPFRGWGRHKRCNNEESANGSPSATTPPEEGEKRIFDKDEGEYVDFEEIKEEKR